LSDSILSSIFLDTSLWAEVIDWGVRKGIPLHTLEYVQDPHGRAELCEQIALDEYIIQPPHTGYAKKDNGTERTFFINDPLTRLLFHAIYLWLMRNESDMIHPSCMSYHEGIGIGRVVKGVSEQIQTLSLHKANGIVGRKFDIHHYFDTIPRELIYKTLDKVGQHHGSSSIIDLIKQYYSSDTYFDTRKHEYIEAYQGIKQGCAVSSWFANVLLYSLDEALASLGECYVRYSDDILYIGNKYEEATAIIRNKLQNAGLQLNEKKTEDVHPDRFVRFLGFDIRGAEITLSAKWVKNFQRNIDQITILNKPLIARVRSLSKQHTESAQRQRLKLLSSATRRLARFLYYGNGTHSWASLVLPIINRESDINQLNSYCLDALRATYTGKTNIGGLGKSNQGGISRGKGRNVTSNRFATNDWLPKYISISAMQKVIHNRWLYRTLVHDMLLGESSQTPYSSNTTDQHLPTIDDIETAYHELLMSEPDGKSLSRFYAHPLSQLSFEDMLLAENRTTANERLESLLQSLASFHHLSEDSSHWFWQSSIHPELVILKEWFMS